MCTVRDDDRQREIRRLLYQIQPADWILKLIDDYQRTGTYRPEDLWRLLGDPNGCVKFGPNLDLESLFSRKSRR